MSFAPPTGLPTVVSTLPAFYKGNWAVFIFPHPTKLNSIRVTSKHMTKQVGITMDLLASQIASFDPEKYFPIGNMK